MNWLHYLSYFLGGALSPTPPTLSARGEPFQSPSAKPPGEGLSSSTVNVLWGSFNLVRLCPFLPRRRFHLLDRAVAASGLGALLLSLALSRGGSAASTAATRRATNDGAAAGHIPIPPELQLPCLGTVRWCPTPGQLEARSQTATDTLHHLQDWCHEAEASGIRALQEFSARLKGYSLHTAHA